MTAKERLAAAEAKLSESKNEVRDAKKAVHMEKAVEAGRVYRQKFDRDYRHLPAEEEGFVTEVSDVIDSHGSYHYRYYTDYYNETHGSGSPLTANEARTVLAEVAKRRG